jgi:hypothetical protein
MRNKRWKVGRRGTRTLVVAELNMRMQPKHRHEMEDAWEGGRDEHGLPSIVGGGTLQSADGEPIRADIEFEFDEAGEETLTLVARVLTAMGAAAGSVLRVRSEPDCALTFGHNEGLAVSSTGPIFPKPRSLLRAQLCDHARSARRRPQGATHSASVAE